MAALTPEQAAQKEAERKQREQDMLAELDEMNLGGPGMEPAPVEEPSAQAASAESVEASPEPEPEDQNQVVAEMSPEELPAETPAAEPPSAEDDYGLDFGDLFKEAIARKLGREQPPAAVSEPPTAQAAPPVQAAPAQVAPPSPRQMPSNIAPPQDLLDGLFTEEQMTEAYDDPKKMIQLLNVAVGKVYARAVLDASEIALRQVPNVMGPVVGQMQAAYTARKQFFEKHPELQGHEDYVQWVTMAVEDKHPEWSMEQVLEESGKVAISRLPGLKQALASTRRESKPSFAKQKGGSANNRPKPTAGISALENEINSMPDVW
jgi:hypothetical protein